ncbi:MAG TPA: oligosaccharyl transferase, archaeosortase A system-associated [Methanoregula sp.]|nr:oligosaccharyl transferase, archaeosortase A system-associated [Methanoregula sp.]
MVRFDLKNRRTQLVIGLVALFSVFALWLRLLPMLTMGNTDVLMMVASDDPLYNLRQVEQILANFPSYAWYDPMSLFPTGMSVPWGPIFPTIIAVFCIISGATTRPEIISTGLLIPPLIGVMIVAIMYFVGKTCGDWKTGLLASGFTAVVSGQFFYRSYYGYMDHHIAEVLFSTVFCLLYMTAVYSEKDIKIDLKNISSYKKTLLLAGLAGIAYLLGLFVMPTMIIFAMIVGIFTIIQFVIDVARGKTSEYLLVMNTVIFAIAIIGLLAYGLKNPGVNLIFYSVGHVYAYLALIGGTGFLYGIARFVKEKDWYYYPVVLIGSGIAFSLILLIVSPQLYDLFINSLFSFFGQQAVTNTVQEARGWAPDLAWMTFNYGLILMAGGALVMFYRNLKDEHPHQIFALVWSLIMLISTWQHIRYEYYLAVNVALLSAVCVSFTFDRGWADIRRLSTRILSDKDEPQFNKGGKEEAPKGKKQKKTHKKASDTSQSKFLGLSFVILTIGLSILFVFTSASLSYANAAGGAIRMNPDWRESLDWMGNNTPDTGVNYTTIYNPQTFRYPPEAYGVMSWWDYGHMITYIAKRIPNANPFQAGVTGPTGSANFFLSLSEDEGDQVLDRAKTRYIITDIEMDTGKFWAMATWYNASAGANPYQMSLLTPAQDNLDSYESILLNTRLYYLTMISRLHNFDGSLTTPTSAYYIEYADPSISQVSLPVITAAEAVNATEAVSRAAEYNLRAPAGYHAAALSPAITLPVETVPALRHYRLVHESPSNVFNSDTIDVKYVKVFEYVKGAHIPGEGIIEVSVISNTGRTFTYRQTSVNGEFIVPYSTTGNPYGVKTTGKYRVISSGREYDVPESAIMEGATIQ